MMWSRWTGRGSDAASYSASVPHSCSALSSVIVQLYRNEDSFLPFFLSLCMPNSSCVNGDPGESMICPWITSEVRSELRGEEVIWEYSCVSSEGELILERHFSMVVVKIWPGEYYFQLYICVLDAHNIKIFNWHFLIFIPVYFSFVL